jgi:muramoyltetrapeptide carboxypeptidase LdcA involved in peptidoglycan recycling
MLVDAMIKSTDVAIESAMFKLILGEEGTALLEEINEPPYRFDRLLTQLLNAGALRGVRAILFGECRDCDAWQSIAIERLKPLGVPMALNLPFGHIDELATFPIGSSATVRIGKQISLTL